jgi:hypothetical protein
LAARIAIVTDESSAEKANAVRDLIRSANCFRDIPDLDIPIRVIDATEISDCRIHGLISRVFYCSDSPQRFAAETNADRVLIIKKDDARAAGSATAVGGIGAAMTTGLDSRGGLHELLHAIGFMDEYAFTRGREADLYCAGRQTGPNLAIFRYQAPYESDEVARQRHRSDIPWYGRITAKAISSPPELGTPEPGKIGLYPAATCEHATTGYRSWRPGDEKEPTIMQRLDGIIPDSFCPAVRHALGARAAGQVPSFLSVPPPPDWRRSGSGSQ